MKVTVDRSPRISEDELNIVLNWWNEEFPVEFKKDSDQFDDWLGNLTNRIHYQLFEDDVFVAWAMAFDRDDERWFSILVPHVKHGKGYGKKLIHELQSFEKSLCGWVITELGLKKANGRTYNGPLGFYKKVNFRETDIRVEFTSTVQPIKIVFP